MTTFNDIPDSAHDLKSPLTINLGAYYRDNLLAVAEGDASAPTLPWGRIYYAEEQKASGTDSATALADGAWVARRDLVEVIDTLGAAGAGGGSIAGANNTQTTLPAGTYWIEAWAPCHMEVDGDGITSDGHVLIEHKLAWYNTSDAGYEIDGASCVFGTGVAVDAVDAPCGQTAELSGKFTIAAAKTFELRHYVNYTGTSTQNETLSGGEATTTGRGEIYARIKLIQLSI